MRSAGRELTAAHGRRIVPWSGVAEPRPHLPLGAVAFVLMVVLPMAFAGIYYFFIASDQYVAEFRFGLRSAEPVRSDPGLLLRQALRRRRSGWIPTSSSNTSPAERSSTT